MLLIEMSEINEIVKYLGQPLAGPWMSKPWVLIDSQDHVNISSKQ